jgi:hypothetical protein
MFASAQKFAAAPRTAGAMAAAAAVAALFAVASPAKAGPADCVGGYRTLENNVVLRCDGGMPEAGLTGYQITGPEVTGSIAATVPAPATEAPLRSLARDANDPSGCTPGGYWYMQLDTSSIPLACR